MTEHTTTSEPAALTSRGSGFRSVLVCLDRSQSAESALPLAAYVAGIDDARVNLLHVLESPPEAAGLRATDAVEWEIARREAQGYLERVTERALKLGVRADGQIAEGQAPREIAAAAAELGADLVVLSRYGEGGADEWNLGGTAQKILAVSRCAVLVTPAGAQSLRVPPRRIMVPLDGSIRGESALPTALRLARENGAEILVAHAVPDPIRTEVLQAPEDLALAGQLADRLAGAAESYLERVRSQLTNAGVRAVGTVCRAADHREGLVALAAARSVDLVVMSAHGSVCNPQRRFGSVTSYLIAHAAVPVLVTQDLPDWITGSTAAQPPRLPPRSVDAGAGRA